MLLLENWAVHSMAMLLLLTVPQAALLQGHMALFWVELDVDDVQLRGLSCCRAWQLRCEPS